MFKHDTKLSTQFIEICTLADVLVATYGNSAEAARLLNANRGTIRKYREMGSNNLVKIIRNEHREIINMEFYTHTAHSTSQGK